MAKFKAECPHCGVIGLRAGDLTVRRCHDREDESAYRFRCPLCERPVVRGASPAICRLLTSAGVEQEVWTRPTELDEHPAGPAFTPDDLLDFHVLLQEDTWHERLLAASG